MAFAVSKVVERKNTKMAVIHFGIARWLIGKFSHPVQNISRFVLYLRTLGNNSELNSRLLMQLITGQLVDIGNRRIYPAAVTIENGKIARIDPVTGFQEAAGELPLSSHFILPGFIDAHVHIESSMLVPSEFARLAVVHGTIGTVSDPHEIANVCGAAGVDFMINNGKRVPFKFCFGAPSCVPATGFETAGARLDEKEVSNLLQREEIKYLSEMMNFPGVLNNDAEVMAKISAAVNAGKPVDGHAPGLRGEDARKYISAGISTDHECFTKEEALEKLQSGMKILIREGSAARNFDALIDLLNDYPERMMFCSDDKHPDSLVAGHINTLCARAVSHKIDIFNILQAACINPVDHYKINAGLLREGDPADFIVVEDLVDFKVLQTFINGNLVAENGRSFITSVDILPINNFNCNRKSIEDFKVTPQLPPYLIEALDGQLITNKLQFHPKEVNGEIVSDPENDILKIVVVNRYTAAPVAKAFIKNIGLKRGALASSVAHDSHNIVAVGVDDASLAKAVNLIIAEKGGVSCADDQQEMIVGLSIAGLMSNKDAYKVADQYTKIDRMAKEMGSTLSAPFMTLSFMALLVIPHLKLSDKGLFDVDAFRII
jgi:adenine deaminase